MASESGADGTSEALDQFILETIRDQCLQLGITDYSPTGLRWAWSTDWKCTFEGPPVVKDGTITLFKGFKDGLRREDWPPQLLYCLIRGQNRIGNIRLAFSILAPIIGLLIAVPILLTSKFSLTDSNGVVTSTTTLGAAIDLFASLPLLFSGAVVYNLMIRKQRVRADRQVQDMMGKQQLLDSLKSLEAYFSTAMVKENAQKLNQIATEEFRKTTGLKNQIILGRYLLYGWREAARRLRQLQRQGS